MQTTKEISFKKFIPGILWLVVILVLILMPGKQIPESEFLFKIDFDKFVHVCIFGLLALLFSWPFYKTAIAKNKKIFYFFTIALLTSLFGYTTELMQKYWAEGRSYSLMDWLADTGGALGAFIFCRIFFTRMENAAKK